MNIDVKMALERAQEDRGRTSNPAVGIHERQAIADRYFLSLECERLYEALSQCRKGLTRWEDR